MLRRFFLLIFLFCFLLVVQALAQNKDLIINGDSVSYDKANYLIEAAGSVEVIYKDVKITSNYVVYNTKLDRAWADHGFVLSYGDITIEGDTLEYEIKKKTGKATDVWFIYQGIELKGKKVQLSVEKFILKDAAFSTCDLEDKHYRVTAADIVFYPKYGWLVAYWGYFWYGPFPIVPMPTYIYDMLASERDRKNIPPFPEIGANDEDGTYINERIAWHIRRELSGSYVITYATRKGLGGGIYADYIVDQDSRGNARAYWNGIDGPFGGVTHSLFFGDEVEGKTTGPFSFYALPKRRQYQFDTTVSYHERINYQRISYYPNLVLKSRKGKIFRDEANLDAELMAGLVAEQGNIRLARGGGIFDFYWDFPETDYGDFTPSLGYDARYYSNGTRWLKSTGGINIEKSFENNISLGLGYLHHFSVIGTSPFNYELYRFNPADRLTSDLSFMFWDVGAGISTSYFLDTWQPEDIDYSLLFRIHCYDLMLKYRSIRREFELGFSLVGE